MSSKTQNRNNFIVVGAALAIASAYAIYDYKKDAGVEIQKVKGSLIVTTPADQVSEFEIMGSENIHLKKTPDGWFFVGPLQERADTESATQFVEGVVLEKYTATVGEGAPIDWSVFGLDKPRATIKIKNNLGEEITLLIGNKKNFQGDSFLRKNQDPRVLVASSTWFQKAEKSVFDFRDKRWAKVAPADLIKITITNKPEHFSLVKKETQWVASEKPEWKLDQNKIRRFISNLSGNQIQKFAEGKPSAPRTSIVLELKDQKAWKGEFGQTKDKKAYLKSSDRDQLAEITMADADEIGKLSLDYFRDRNEPFQFRKEDVKYIEYSEGSETAKKEIKGESAETQALQTLLSRVQGLELTDFIGGNDSPEVHGPNSARLVLNDINQKMVLELNWNVSGTKRIMKSSSFPSVFSVTEEKIVGLKLDSIFFPAKEKK